MNSISVEETPEFSPTTSDAPAHDSESPTGVRRILAVLTQLGVMNLALGLGGVVRNKVMAVYLKPAGFGEFTQLAALANAVYVFVQFGMAVGLSRHAAAHREQDARQRQLSAANFLTVGLSVVSLALLLPALLSSASNAMLSSLGVLPSFENKIIIAVLLAVAPIEALRNNYLCFLTGILDIKGMSVKRSFAIVVSTAVAVPLIALFHAAGAGAQMAFGSLFLAVLLGRRCREMGYRPLGFTWDKKITLTLAEWGGACLVSNLALNSIETVIRGHLIASAGASANGLYQSASLLSGQIMAIILGSIGAYSLATLSETKDPSVATLRMADLLRVILPLTTISLGFLGLLSRPLLAILFSSPFRAAATFFPLQLSANYFQSAAWIVGAPLLGFGFVRTWMFIQLAGSALRYVVTILLAPVIGVAHAVPAGLLLAVAFDLLASIVFCFRIGIHFDLRTVRAFLLGGGAILACAVVGNSSLPVAVFFVTALFLLVIVAVMAWRETEAALQIAQLRFRSFICK